MSVKFTEEQQQQILAAAADLSLAEQGELLQMIKVGSYLEDAAKVSYDAGLRPFIDQWVDKVKDTKSYRAQMWIVRRLAAMWAKWRAAALGSDAVEMIAEYGQAIDAMLPKYEAAKVKIKDDPKEAVNGIFQAFDDLHGLQDGYFKRLATLFPIGAPTWIVTALSPTSQFGAAPASVVGWLAYKRLMHKAIKEATKLQRAGGGVREPEFAKNDMWATLDKKKQQAPAAPTKDTEVQEALRALPSSQYQQLQPAAPEVAPVPLTKVKQAPTPRPSAPLAPAPSAGFTFDPAKLRQLMKDA